MSVWTASIAATNVRSRTFSERSRCSAYLSSVACAVKSIYPPSAMILILHHKRDLCARSPVQRPRAEQLHFVSIFFPLAIRLVHERSRLAFWSTSVGHRVIEASIEKLPSWEKNGSGSAALSSMACVQLDEEGIAHDFRGAVKSTFPNLLEPVDAPDLRVYKNRAEFDDTKQQDQQEHLKSPAALEDLGREEDEALIVEVPKKECVSTVQLFHDGLNPQVSHLEREQLLGTIYESMEPNRNRFILFVSPAASGKASLLSLFARRHDHLHYLRFILS
ncbi:hypothetical protein FI667_g13079, partial [Globisporangium splendens]